MGERYAVVIEFDKNQYDINQYEMLHVDVYDTYEEAEAEAKATCECDGSFAYYIVKLIPCAKVYIPNPNVVVEKL